MNREQTITAEKINNLISAIVEVLNSDIENSDSRGIDPFDHLTALSFVLSNAALELGVTKQEFITGVVNSFDACIESRKEQQ